MIGLGLGWCQRFFFVFSVLPTPPVSCGAMVWVIGQLNWGTPLIFRVGFFFVLPTLSSASSRGGGEDNLATHTVEQDCVSF